MNIKTVTEITTGFTFAGPDRMQHLNKVVWTAVQGGRPNPTIEQQQSNIKPAHQDRQRQN